MLITLAGVALLFVKSALGPQPFYAGKMLFKMMRCAPVFVLFSSFPSSPSSSSLFVDVERERKPASL